MKAKRTQVPVQVSIACHLEKNAKIFQNPNYNEDHDYEPKFGGKSQKMAKFKLYELLLFWCGNDGDEDNGDIELMMVINYGNIGKDK